MAFWTVRLMLNALRGSGHHLLELGGSAVLGRQGMTESDRSTARSAITALTATAGYRYQRPDRGWLRPVGVPPIHPFGTEDRPCPDRGFFPPIGPGAGPAC
jgi:hypothetical protein